MEWQALASRVLAWTQQATLPNEAARQRAQHAARLVLAMAAGDMELPERVYLTADEELVYEWSNGLTITVGGQEKA